MSSKNNIKVAGVSMVGFSFAELVTNPINVARVVYQTNDYTLKQTISNIYTRKAYFKGLQVALLTKTISLSLKYTLYDFIKNYRGTERDDLFGNMVNGMVSGVIGTTVTNPLMVWRTRLQRGDSMHLKYSYNGYLVSVARCIPLYSLLFPCYDFYKSKLGDSVMSGVAAAVMTTITNAIFTHPFDEVACIMIIGHLSNIENLVI